jgi:hypothetical protein
MHAALAREVHAAAAAAAAAAAVGVSPACWCFAWQLRPAHHRSCTPVRPPVAFARSVCVLGACSVRACARGHGHANTTLAAAAAAAAAAAWSSATDRHHRPSLSSLAALVCCLVATTANKSENVVRRHRKRNNHSSSSSSSSSNINSNNIIINNNKIHPGRAAEAARGAARPGRGALHPRVLGGAGAAAQHGAGPAHGPA